MKHSFTLALLLLCAGTLQAQINKGTQLLTGSFNIGGSKQESNNNNESKRIAAGIGVGRQWMHKENRIRGFIIDYNYNSNTYDYLSAAGETKRTSNSFQVGYVSQYLLPFGKKFYGTATILTQFSFSKHKEQFENNSINNTNGESYGLGLGIQPGLAYQLNKRWIADVTMGNLVGAYINHGRSRATSPNNYKDRSTSFNLNSMFSGNSTFLGIGFRYILR